MTPPGAGKPCLGTFRTWRTGLAPVIVPLLLIAWTVLSPAPARAQGLAAYLISDEWTRAQISHAQATVSTEAGHERVSYLVRIKRPPGGAAKELIWVLPIGLPAGKLSAEAGAHLQSFSGTYVAERAERELRRALGVLVGMQIWTLPIMTPSLLVEKPRLPPTVLETGPLMRANAARVTLMDSQSFSRGEHPTSPDSALPPSLLAHLAPLAKGNETLAVFRSKPDAALDGPENTLAMNIRFPIRGTWVPWLGARDEQGRFIEAQVVVEGFVRVPSELPAEYFTGFFAGPGQPNPNSTERATVLRTFPELAPPTLGYELPEGSPDARSRFAEFASGEHAAWLYWVAALGYFIVAALLAALVTRPIWPHLARPTLRTTALLGLSNLGTVIAFLSTALLLGKRARVSVSRTLIVVVATSLCIAALVLAAAVAVRSLFA